MVPVTGAVHGITEFLDVCQVSRLRLEDGQLAHHETVDAHRIDGGYMRFECRCGEEFRSIDAAEEHMQGVVG